jgi:hypothetical protein
LHPERERLYGDSAVEDDHWSYIFMGEGGAGPADETIWEKTPLIW